MVRTALVGLVLLVPAAASAQRRHDGFVGQLHLGLGGCTNDACDEENWTDAEFGAGASFGAFVGYRFPWPWVSVGANLQYSIHSVDDEEDFADDLEAHSFAFDFGVRAHPLVEGPIDPWAGLGFGYAWAGSSWQDDRQPDPDESESASGPGVSLSLGADWWVHESFAVGLAFRYVVVFWSEVCLETDLMEEIYQEDVCEDPDEWEERSNVFFQFDEDDLPNLWQFLLTGTFAP